MFDHFNNKMSYRYHKTCKDSFWISLYVPQTFWIAYLFHGHALHKCSMPRKRKSDWSHIVNNYHVQCMHICMCIKELFYIDIYSICYQTFKWLNRTHPWQNNNISYPADSHDKCYKCKDPLKSCNRSSFHVYFDVLVT